MVFGVTAWDALDGQAYEELTLPAPVVLNPPLPDLARRPDSFDNSLRAFFGHGRHVVSPLAKPYCDLRRFTQVLDPSQKARLRSELLAQLTDEESHWAHEAFRGAALVVLPGLLNYSPSNECMNLLTAPFGHGGIFVSVAQDEGVITDRGLFTMVGGDVRALHPDWRGELALVIDRLAHVLQDTSRPHHKSERLVFLGHSKGGLLTHALAALVRHYDYLRHDGTFPETIYRIFPGLSLVSRSSVVCVMNYLKDADFHLLASPVEGLPSNLFLGAFDLLFLNTAVQHFSPEFIRNHFETLGFGPDIVDSLMTSDRPSTFKRAVQDDSGVKSAWGLVASKATRAIFHGAAHFVKAAPGDGIVPALKGEYPNAFRLPGQFDHLQQLESPQAARHMLGRLTQVALAKRARTYLNVGVRVPMRTMASTMAR